MNESMKILYDEHTVIINAIDVARNAASLIGKDDAEYEKTIRDLIYFFRTYADEFHHHKEEVILFPEMSKQNELLADGVLKEMLENHEDFREMVRSIEQRLNEKQFHEAQKLLDRYTNALLDHIAAENEELFPMTDSLMSETELQSIYFRFKDCDRELGEQKKEDLVELADALRKSFI